MLTAVLSVIGVAVAGGIAAMRSYAGSTAMLGLKALFALAVPVGYAVATAASGRPHDGWAGAIGGTAAAATAAALRPVRGAWLTIAISGGVLVLVSAAGRIGQIDGQLLIIAGLCALAVGFGGAPGRQAATTEADDVERPFLRVVPGLSAMLVAGVIATFGGAIGIGWWVIAALSGAGTIATPKRVRGWLALAMAMTSVGGVMAGTIARVLASDVRLAQQLGATREDLVEVGLFVLSSGPSVDTPAWLAIAASGMFVLAGLCAMRERSAVDNAG